MPDRFAKILTTDMKVLIIALLAGYVTSLNTKARIVGGSDADIADYPWHGALRYAGGFTCGAVLISSNQVLTAAHCVDGRETPSYLEAAVEANSTAHFSHKLTPSHDSRSRSMFTIRFGSSQQGSGGTIYNVQSITKHSGYASSGGYPNDIASMQLSSNASGSNISPVDRLDNRPYDYLHTDCVISGWGRTCGSCSTASTLQVASTTCISRSQCSSYWNNIGDYHQCLYNGQTGACSGDSGSPLVCQDGGNTLVGITSWGSASCSVLMPSVYVRVSYYCAWILANTGVSCG